MAADNVRRPSAEGSNELKGKQDRVRKKHSFHSYFLENAGKFLNFRKISENLEIHQIYYKVL